jgi:hypothetical protein
MAMFDFHDEMLSIVDEHGHCIELSLQEAIALLQWASNNQKLRFHLSESSTAQRDTEKGQIEINLQQHLLYLNTLKAAIPHLQQHPTMATTFVAPVDEVTQQALQLLKAFQIEYKVHPLLEDPNVFAQG